MVALGFTVLFLVATKSFLVVALLQYSFLVVTVLFSGSNSTCFWLLQYSCLVATVLFFSGHGPLFVVVKLLVSGFYSIYFWLVL
jgi:hypothetical protein